MQIAEILGRNGVGVIALLPDTLVSGAALLMSDQAIGAAVIINPDRGMIGILSERDVARGLGQYGGDVSEMSVDALMSKDVITCDPESTVADALAIMKSMNVRHLPVVDADNHLVGMVSMRDLVVVEPQQYRVAS